MARSNLWRWGLAAAAVGCLVLLGVLYQGFGRDPHEVPFLMKGKPAPAFSLRRLDNGETVSLATFAGKPLVVNFWASWCGPCKLEHPVLSWGASEFGEQVGFLGVVFEDTDDGARRYLLENGAGFPQLVDPLSKTSVDYGVAGVPETYFIDRRGVIVDKYVGPIPAQVLAEHIRALLRT